MRYVFDTETMSDFFSITFLDYDSDKIVQFEISDRKNELKELKRFLKNVSYLIGFNSVHFDNIILQYIVENNIQDAKEIYKISQIVINQDVDWESFKELRKYSYWKDIHSIDLFLYWSKGLRMSKKLSLKYFAVNLDEEVLEMPIHHSKANLTDEEKDMILSYNINDVVVTKKLAQKLKEEINLRFYIQKEYSLKCLSWDAPKIASELLLDTYCKETANNKQEIRQTKYTKPYNIRLGDFLPDIKYETKLFQDLYEWICNSYNTINTEFLSKNPDGSFLKISVGIGGIHSVNKNQKFISGNGIKIYTSDIQSLYPTNIIYYEYISPRYKQLLDIYKNVKEERIIAKKEKQKTKDTFFKLILNSFSGLLDSPVSWLYAPEQVLGLRLTGQLQLLKLTEMFQLNGISVISMNTDGLEVLLKDEQVSLYHNLLEEHSKIFNVNWEVDIYKSIHYVSVNDYIAITDKGDVKQKGMFISKKQIDASNEFLIIPIALKEYFVNKTPIEVTIRNYENIYDFCCAKKIAKNFRVFYKGSPTQQLNRFFVSDRTNGAYLYKQKDTKSTMENVLKDTPVYILNEKTENSAKDFPVNYVWYIKKAQEIIDIFEPKQLTLF